MCRWLAYAGRPIFLENLVSKPCHSLIQQSQAASECLAPTNGDGFGVGWYGAWDEPGVFREAMPAWSDDNLRCLTHQISSSLFFAHVRASTGTETIRTNCHPFVSGRWMFMHNGQIGGWSHIRRRIEGRLSDTRYAERRGSTDSEVLFLMLEAAALAADPVEALADVLIDIREIMLEAGITDPLRLTAALTDGHRLYAFRYASDAHPPTLYWQKSQDGIVVVSEPIDACRNKWTPVEADTVLIIDRCGDVALHPFIVEERVSRPARVA